MFIPARKMSMFLLSKTCEIPFRNTFVERRDDLQSVRFEPDRTLHQVIKNAVIDRLTNDLARPRTLEKLLTAPVPPITIEINSL